MELKFTLGAHTKKCTLNHSNTIMLKFTQNIFDLFQKWDTRIASDMNGVNIHNNRYVFLVNRNVKWHCLILHHEGLETFESIEFNRGQKRHHSLTIITKGYDGLFNSCCTFGECNFDKKNYIAFDLTPKQVMTLLLVEN